MKKGLINWLNNIQKIDGIPPKEVIAFNFGIYESETGYKIYLVGSFEYDENDDDWACIEMPTKSHRYFDLPKELQSKAWDEILTACANSLIELEKEGKLKIDLFKNAIAITAGFDDGELIKIR
jgi:hypothetical protein